MKILTVILLTIMYLEVLCAPQNKPVKKADFMGNVANLSFEELQFIAQVRKGEPTKPPKTMSPCARAILGCCNNKIINIDCSEKLNCGGHFFDDNPCEDKFIIDALNAAKSFYDQFNKVNS